MTLVSDDAADDKHPIGPSLVKPDFDGLWSVAWIGGKYNEKQESSICNSILPFIAVSIVTISWIVGFLSPIIIFSLIYFKFYLLTAILSGILVYPYVVKINPLPSVCRFYVKYGCNYFEGGASMIYEEPPNDLSLPFEKRKPSMVAYHPHGIFCMGFYYNSGLYLFITIC